MGFYYNIGIIAKLQNVSLEIWQEFRLVSKKAVHNVHCSNAVIRVSNHAFYYNYGNYKIAR